VMGLLGFMVKAIVTIDEQNPGGSLVSPINVQPAAVVSN